MLSYRSTQEFVSSVQFSLFVSPQTLQSEHAHGIYFKKINVSTREKIRVARSAAECFSAHLECTYKFPSASVTQHSKRTSFIFLSKISQINKLGKNQANFKFYLYMYLSNYS